MRPTENCTVNDTTQPVEEKKSRIIFTSIPTKGPNRDRVLKTINFYKRRKKLSKCFYYFN